MIERFEIPVDFRTPGGTTNAYFLSNQSVVIDPPVPIADLPLHPSTVEHVVCTHTHPDHVQGVRSFAIETDATVWAPFGREAAFVEATGVEPDGSLQEGDRIDSTDVLVHRTPGHSPDHLSFRIEAVLIVGDLAMANQSVFVGSPAGDMRAYLTSLRRMMTLDVDVAYPGHGPSITDPSERFAELIDHRLEREDRILQAVRGGHGTPPEVVRNAYSEDLTGVEDLAERTVVSHLEKLAVEGKVHWDGTAARRR